METNILSAGDFQNISNEECAVAKVMPDHFKFNKDIVNETVSLSLLQDDFLEGGDNIYGVRVEPPTIFSSARIIPVGGDGFNVNMDVIAMIHAPKHFVDSICLNFVSHTSQWTYLENHDFTARFDTNKIWLPAAYSNATEGDGTVIEQFFVTFTPKQFHDMAWANVTAVKLGSENYLIPREDRVKWKLLWNYSNLNEKLNR